MKLRTEKYYPYVIGIVFGFLSWLLFDSIILEMVIVSFPYSPIWFALLSIVMVVHMEHRDTLIHRNCHHRLKQLASIGYYGFLARYRRELYTILIVAQIFCIIALALFAKVNDLPYIVVAVYIGLVAVVFLAYCRVNTIFGKILKD